MSMTTPSLPDAAATPPGGRRTPAIIRTMRGSVGVAAAAIALAGGIQLALLSNERAEPPALALAGPLVAFVYAAVGVLARWRRPSNRLGVLLLGGSVAFLLSWLTAVPVPILAAIGTVAATLPLAVAVHLLHAFPSGRCRSRFSRVTVAAGYVVCLVLQAPLYVFDPTASPGGMLALADSPGIVDASRAVQALAGLAVMAATAWVLYSRLARAPRGQRRVLAPLYAYGMVAVLAVPLVPDITRATGGDLVVSAGVQTALLAVVPVAVTVAMFTGGFARTGDVQELGAWLGQDDATRPSLGDALARTLGDPTLQLAFWVPSHAVYTDGHGTPVQLPGPDAPDRGCVGIDHAGAPIGAIIYDTALLDDPEAVRSAGRVIALAVEQERLTADLHASHQELERSRSRVLEAADRERRRLAQDLHDGLQAELVMLAIQAQHIAGLPGTPPQAAASAVDLRRRIDHAATELRQIVHGLAPAALLERGLPAAVDDLADRTPVPTSVHTDIDGRLPAPVESTAYYLIAEALTNTVKHAHASRIEISMRHTDHTLTVTVADDGSGGATAGGGLGLSGIADRVDTAGGRLTVDSPLGGGTRMTAELPCAS